MKLKIYKAIDGFRGRVYDGSEIIFQSTDVYETADEAFRALRLPHMKAKENMDTLSRLVESSYPADFACGSIGKLIRELQQDINKLL